jgi:hypothetical protein
MLDPCSISGSCGLCSLSQGRIEGQSLYSICVIHDPYKDPVASLPGEDERTVPLQYMCDPCSISGSCGLCGLSQGRMEGQSLYSICVIHVLYQDPVASAASPRGGWKDTPLQCMFDPCSISGSCGLCGLSQERME